VDTLYIQSYSQMVGRMIIYSVEFLQDESWNRSNKKVIK